MADFDPKRVAEDLTAIVKSHVRRELAPLRKRIGSLESELKRLKGFRS